MGSTRNSWAQLAVPRVMIGVQREGECIGMHVGAEEVASLVESSMAKEDWKRGLMDMVRRTSIALNH